MRTWGRFYEISFGCNLRATIKPSVTYVCKCINMYLGMYIDILLFNYFKLIKFYVINLRDFLSTFAR
jgi:hypothetical protein